MHTFMIFFDLLYNLISQISQNLWTVRIIIWKLTKVHKVSSISWDYMDFFLLLLIYVHIYYRYKHVII